MPQVMTICPKGKNVSAYEELLMQKEKLKTSRICYKWAIKIWQKYDHK